MAIGEHTGIYKGEMRTDYLFRISVKAVVRDSTGKLLVTNEADRGWHLPGGGLDHGESIEACLKRELKEEIGYEGNVDYRVIAAEPMYMNEELDIWQLWLVLDVVIDSFEFMDDRSSLIEVEELAGLQQRNAQLSYKFAQIATRKSKG